MAGGTRLFILLFIALFILQSCSNKPKSRDDGDSQAKVLITGSLNIKKAKVTVYSSNIDGGKSERVETETSTGIFSVYVPAFEGGGRVVVTADGGKGYVKATRTLKYSKPEQIDNVNVNLRLLKYNTKLVDPKAGLTINEEGKAYIRVKLDDSGKFISQQKGEATIFELSIPAEYIYSQGQVEIRYRSFRPSNTEDYSFFPGDENEEGKRLISVGFDYLEIVNTQTGKSIFEGVRAKQGQEVLRILRWVDMSQLERIKNKKGTVDEDKNKGGVQIVFYAFDSSKGYWVRAGTGVLVKDPNVNYTGTDFDRILSNGCSDRQDCSNNGVFWDDQEIFNYGNAYAVVSVTNPDLAWKNLDYIVPGDPVSCVIKVRDKDGNPLSVFVEAVPDSLNNIEYVYGFTGTNGSISLQTITYGDPANAIIYFYDPRRNWVVEGVCEETKSSKVTFGRNCSCTINADIIKECKVEGSITDNSQNPLVNAFVEIKGQRFYKSTYTDSNGKYSVTVPCERRLEIYVDFEKGPYTFNVNGMVEESENSDDGNTAVVNIQTNVCYVEGVLLYNNNPVKGVNVYAGSLDQSVTGDDGSYRMRIPCSEATIAVSKSPDVGACNCSISLYLKANPDGRITGDEIYDDGVTVRLKDFDIAPCFVDGTVNTAVNLQDVYLYSVAPYFYMSRGSLNTNNAFNLPVLCNVDFNLSITRRGQTYINIFATGLNVDGNAVNPEVSDDGSTVGININLSCSVTGTVSDNSNNPVSGTYVNVSQGYNQSNSCNLSLCLNGSISTDTAGNYTLPVLCRTQGSLFVSNYQCNKQLYSFNVNGSRDNDEFSDNNTSARVDITGCASQR